MSTPLARRYAFDAINSERAYQDKRWAGYEEHNGNVRTDPIDRSLDEFILYIKQYADEAGHLTTHGDEAEALNFVRKVGALCIGCMEKHGAPRREGF